MLLLHRGRLLRRLRPPRLQASASAALLPLPRQPQAWARFSTSTSTSTSSSRANALRQALQASVAQAGAAEEPLLAVYDRLVREGSLRPDPQQRRVARRLDRLASVLKGYKPPILVLEEAEEREKEKAREQAAATAKADGALAWASYAPAAVAAADVATAQAPVPQQGVEEKQAMGVEPEQPPSPSPSRLKVLRGIYIHGQVGTGKSLLMDLFFHHCPLAAKRRVHFHEFMLEVHARIHAWKQQALAREGRTRHIDLRPERNAIVQVARAVAREAHLLCFDEFQVTDVADALIMASLFGELWRQGVVVLATSNRAPDELYLDGLNRPYFLPFIGLLARQCAVVDMGSGVDHRTKFRGAVAESYFTPLDAEASAKLEAAYLALTDNNPGAPTTIPVMMGRSLRVPRAHDNGVCRFAFADLCKADVFAADYHAVCARFHTVVLEGVPTLSTEKHNEARRFITLVDVLYETRTRLLMSAAAPVNALFQEPARVSGAAGAFDGAAPSLEPLTTRPPDKKEEAEEEEEEEEEDPLLKRFVDAAQELVVPEGELASVKELAFAFQRAASRLTEMASEEYLEAHAETRVLDWEAEWGEQGVCGDVR